MTIDKTLEERGSRYGTIEDNATVTQSLMEVLESKGKNFSKLSKIHKECIHMIFHKIGRMVSGDPNYIDNVHDIVGYAKLLEDYLIENEKESKESKEKPKGRNWISHTGDIMHYKKFEECLPVKNNVDIKV